MAFTYIASPYSHPDPAVRQQRYRETITFTAEMLKANCWCFSPIVHCHELTVIHGLPTDATYWKYYNTAMLSAARSLIVLKLEGWANSKGVIEEIAIAKGLNIPISYMYPDAKP